MENVRTMKLIGVDFWDRPVYKCLENGHLWKDINLGKGEPCLYSSSNNEMDGEPCSPINPELTIDFKTQYKENPHEFEYQMLGRLKSDCDYYLGHGNRSASRLWAGSESEQIKEMKRRWNDLSDDAKPEWLTWDDILQYAANMEVRP